MNKIVSPAVVVLTCLSLWLLYLSRFTSLSQNQYFLYLAATVEILTAAGYVAHMFSREWSPLWSPLDPICAFVWLVLGAMTVYGGLKLPG
jgi:hypothetical protein